MRLPWESPQQPFILALFSLFLGMATPKIRAVGVVIDKITNSIEHVETGEVFATSMVRLVSEDLAQIKKTKWLFDWKDEATN